MIDAAIGRASTLDERLRRCTADAPSARRSPPATDAAWPELDAWCGAVTNTDWPTFAKRLAWDGLEPESAARAADASSAIDALPAWTRTSAAVYGRTAAECAAAFASTTDQPDRACRLHEPLPFEELFVPLVAHARDRLAREAGDALHRMGVAAHASLERALLERLTHICARALFGDFSAARSLDGQSTALAALLGQPANGRARYDRFVAEHRAGRLLDFFGRYPVAARLCATVTEQWVDATAELLVRLAADWSAVECLLGVVGPLPPVRSVRTGVSDPHAGGRSVIIVGWDDEKRVVYKPRSLGPERGFAELLAWLGRQDSAPALRAPALVVRPGYGWVEFVEPCPAGSVDGVRRYFERCGALLCIAYALNGSDFHCDNLIAAGEFPVLIDLETLLAPRFALGERLAGQEFAAAGARQRLVGSVLSTLLLPHLKPVDGGCTIDLGGLTGELDLSAPAGAAGWTAVNTDRMAAARPHHAAVAGRNVARLAADGEIARADAHVEQIVDGFERTYRTLLARRDELLADGGPLAGLAGDPFRFVFRNSSLYATLLERALHPDYLRDGFARGAQLDVLSRTLLVLDARPDVWPVIAAERDALEAMDIPLLTVAAGSRDLGLPSGTVIPDCFEASALEEAVRRIRSFTEPDMAVQVGLIRGALRANGARGLRTRDRTPHQVDDAAIPRPCERLRERASAWALRVADALRERGAGPAGSATSWLTTSFIPEARRYRLGPAPASLFDGYPGIAVFLAALERVSGGAAGVEPLALAALAPLREQLAEVEQVVRRRRVTDVGAGTGLGSAVYALAHTGRLLHRPDLVADARRLAALLTVEAAESSGRFDVVSGAAGSVLSLLALHDTCGDEALVARAAAIGARVLLPGRVREPGTGLQLWPGVTGQPEAGLAHGQAGVAYALHRLAAAADEPRFAEAADEAIAYERCGPGPVVDRAAAAELDAPWAHGATGIGLARLAGRIADDGVADASADTEVAAVVGITRRHLLDGVDSMGCGIAARIELLLTASRSLGRPDLADSARGAATHVLAGADARGGFRTGWADGVTQLGLFHGAAGTAYMLLRTCHPDTLPALLRWE